MYGRHLVARAMRRPAADVLGRSWNQHVRRLDSAGIAQHASSGFWCEALTCRRTATHVIWYQFRHRGQVLDGEMFRCDRHARRYARRYHVRIEDPPVPGNHRGPR
jgi:hypothetical protein